MENEAGKKRVQGVVKAYLSKEARARLNFLAGYLWAGDNATPQDEINNAVEVSVAAMYAAVKNSIQQERERGKINTNPAGTGTGGGEAGGCSGPGPGDGGAVSPMSANNVPDATPDGAGWSGTDGGGVGGDSPDAAASGRRRGRK